MNTPDLKPSSVSLTESSPVPGAFFITGGTMRPGAPSYVERTADRELLEALRRSEFCYVLDTRQMGKSSLMARVANKLRENCAVATIDLTAFGQSVSLREWYDAQISALGRQFSLEGEIEDFIDQHESLGPVDRWVKVIRDVIVEKIGKPIIIFVDEIDYVRSLPFPTDEYFAAIRHFYNARAFDPKLDWLTFCLLGVSTPNDLIRDEEVTPFNLGRRIVITDFSQRDAEPVLLQGLDGDEDVARQKLDRVFFWTDGHPYLTQRLCEAVKMGSGSWSLDSVDRACENLFLMPGAREATDTNLRFAASRLLIPGSEADVLDLYGKVLRKEPVFDDGKQPFAETLKLSGIAKTVNGKLRVRNEIYRHVFDQRWIDENMPDQEKRRLEEVARRVRRRALLVGLSILAALCALALAAYFGARNRQLQRETSTLQELTNKLASVASDESSQKAEAEREARLAQEAARKEQILTKLSVLAKNQAIAQAARAKDAEAVAHKNAESALAAETDAQNARAATNIANEELRKANNKLAEEKARADSLQRITNAEMLRQTQPAQTETAALLAIEGASSLESDPEISSRLRNFAILGKTEARFAIPGLGSPRTITLSPNQRYLAVLTSGSPKKICDVDLTSHKANCVEVDGTVVYLAISDVGALTILLRGSGQDHSVWQRGNPLVGTKLSTVNGISPSTETLALGLVSVSEDGCQYAEGGESSVTVSDLCSEGPPRTLRKDHTLIHVPLRFDNSGRFLATISIQNGSASIKGGSATISIWDVQHRTFLPREVPAFGSCIPQARNILNIARERSAYFGDPESNSEFQAGWSSLPSAYPTLSADLAVIYCHGSEETRDQILYSGGKSISPQDIASRFAISEYTDSIARVTGAGVEIVQKGGREPLYLPGIENVSALHFFGRSDMLAVTQQMGQQVVVRVFNIPGFNQVHPLPLEQSRIVPPANSRIFYGIDRVGLISSDLQVRLLSFSPGASDASTQISSPISQGGLFAVTSDGRYVVAGAADNESKTRLYSLSDADYPSLRSTPYLRGMPEALSADGSVLVAGQTNGRFSLISTQSDSTAPSIHVARSVLAVSANGQLIAFSADQCGDLLGTASKTCIEVYDRTTAKTVTRIPLNALSANVSAGSAVSFSQDNLSIHVVDGQYAQTWDLAKNANTPAWSQKLPSGSIAVSFTQDGSRAVIVLQRFGNDMFWNTQNREISFLTSALSRNSVISNDGRHIAGAPMQGGIVIYDLPTGNPVFLPVDAKIQYGNVVLRFDHASSHVAGLSGAHLCLVSLNGHLLTRDIVPNGRLLGFSADDSRVGVSTNAAVQWYRTDTLAEIGKPFVSPDASGVPLLSQNGQWLATGTAVKRGAPVQIVGLRQSAPGSALESNAVIPTALAVAPGTNLPIAVGGRDGLVHLASTVPDSSKLPVMDLGSPVTSLSWSPDGTYVAAASDTQVSVFSAEHGTRLAQCNSNARIIGTAFSFNHSLMFATEQGDINVITTSELNKPCSPILGRKITPISDIYSSPSGDSVITVSSDLLMLWDSHDWSLRKDIRVSIRAGLKFSPDGSQFAAITNARTLEVWEAGLGRQTAAINTDYDIIAFAFSPDETVLATASRNLIELWNIDRTAKRPPRLISSVPSQLISDVAFDPITSDLVVGSSVGIGLPIGWRRENIIRELCDRILRPTQLSEGERATYMHGGTYVDYCAEPQRIKKD